METVLGQLLTDTGISSNWLIAGLLTLLIFMIKRTGDKADAREKKIDEILEKQSEAIGNLEKMVALHDQQLTYDVSKSNEDLLNKMMLKMKSI